MSYTQISLGSQDEDVKTAQELLNSTGRYNLAVDGIFGEQTSAAVKEYQRENGLVADGVIGPQTWAALTGGTQQSPEQETPNTDYETYTQKLEALYDAWTERDPFSYNVQSDPLYQQYREIYTQQGRLAMEDTLGQAAALTGGYGSTYAQTAGQQTFQNYMQQLSQVVPELYDRAYDRYQDQGNRLWQQYQLTQSMADDAYAKEGAAANIMAQIGDYTRLGDLYGLSDEEIQKITSAQNPVYYDSNNDDRITWIRKNMDVLISGGASPSTINAYLTSYYNEGNLTKTEYDHLKDQYVPRTGHY